MIKRIKTLFLLKRSSTYSEGPVPIYLRITIEGKRSEASIQRTCEPSRWDQRKGRAIGSKNEAAVLNSYLEIIQCDVYSVQKEFALKEIVPTPDQFLARLVSKGQQSKLGLIKVFRDHNVQFEKLVGKEFALGILKKFKTALRHLEDFISWKYDKKEINLAMVNHLFVKDYEFYMKTVSGLQHNTATSNIKKLKKVIRHCVANEWMENDPFKAYKITTKETHRVFLMNDELVMLQSKDFDNARLNQVQDIFLFSCYTGLSYSDVIKLCPADVSIGIDGEEWIFTKRTKTDSQSRVPLLPTAKAILEKYKKNLQLVLTGKLPPNLSNEKLNAYLKEISALCGLSKLLTFHCARHTFATTVTLTNGVPIETVGKMLGHKSLRTTQIYAKILDGKVSEDMMRLKLRLLENKHRKS